MILFHATQYLTIQHIIIWKLCPYSALNTRKRKGLLALHLDYDGLLVGKATCDVLDAFNWNKPMNLRVLSLTNSHLDICVSIQVLLFQFIEDKHNGSTLSLILLDFNKPFITFGSHLYLYLKHHTFLPFR